MIRKTIEGMQYGQSKADYYWNPKYNPEANVKNGLPNCTEAAYGLILEAGMLPPVSVISDASHWHEYLINGWTFQPYEAYKENIKEGDILEWTKGNHVAVVSQVNGGIKVSASFYTGIHGKAYYNGGYDTREGISTLKELNDYFFSRYPYRYFHFATLETECSWCGAEPAYVLISPQTITPDKRDEFKNQIYVGVEGLRLRSEPNTAARVNGTTPVGYYSAEKINGEEWQDRGVVGDVWYKIGNYYVAGVQGVDYLPAKESEPISEIEKLLKDLNNEIKTLKDENKELRNRLERIKDICNE